MKDSTLKWILGSIAAAFVGGIGYATYKGRNPVENALGGNVINRTWADGTRQEVQDALDDWNANGPFQISIGWDGGLRTNAKQISLYKQGRTGVDDSACLAWKPGSPEVGTIVDKTKVVTNAPNANNSAHGRGAAFDVWPVINTQPHADNDTPEANDKYNQIVAWFTGRGWVSGSTFKSPVDWPHFELANWRSLPLIGA